MADTTYVRCSFKVSVAPTINSERISLDVAAKVKTNCKSQAGEIKKIYMQPQTNTPMQPKSQAQQTNKTKPLIQTRKKKKKTTTSARQPRSQPSAHFECALPMGIRLHKNTSMSTPHLSTFQSQIIQM